MLDPNDQAQKQPKKDKDRKFATTLARGLSVLRAFRPSDTLLGNQEISERTKLPKSTVSRLTYTLSKLGYLNHLKDVEKYRLGPSLLALGNVAQSNLTFLQAANPMMQQLANETGTLISMFVRDGLKMLLAQCWRPQDVPAIWLEVGHRLPLYKSSSGLAYLASISESELLAISTQMQDEGIVTSDELRAEVIRTRGELISQGTVYVLGQYVEGLNAVSVPFRNSEFTDTFIFTSGAMDDVLNLERIKSEVGPLLKQRVQSLELAMGYSHISSSAF